MWPALPWTLPGHKHLTLETFHSAGGQGVVYRATDSVQGKEVAVKLLARSLDPAAYEDEIDRFAREKAAMDFISHAASLPMFVDVYDFHRGSQEPSLEQAPAFLEMEFIQWPTLGNVIRDRGKLPVDTVFLVALELAQALRIMSRRIIHNDIKPHNLFVDIKKDKVDLKVGDFGIWVPDDDKVVTQVGAGPGIAGTIAYMSPEQSSGERWDSRSDIYAACCVIWQCCVGGRPFPRIPSNKPILEQLKERLRITQDFPECPDSMPAELYDVLHKGLQHDPRARHENANEFRSHLQDAYRKWRVRVDEEGRRYLARLEGVAASLAAQRQKLSSYYLAYVELNGFTSEVEQALDRLRDGPSTANEATEQERSLEAQPTEKFDPDAELVDLERIERAIGKARTLLTSEDEDSVTGRVDGPPGRADDTAEREDSFKGPEDGLTGREDSFRDPKAPTVRVGAPNSDRADDTDGDVGDRDAEDEADDRDASADEEAAPAVGPSKAAEEHPPRERSSVLPMLGIVAAAAAVLMVVLFMSGQKDPKPSARRAEPKVDRKAEDPSPSGIKTVDDGARTPPASGAPSTSADVGAGASTGPDASASAGSGTDTGASPSADTGASTTAAADTGADTGAATGTVAASESGDAASAPSSDADARKAQWLESTIAANDQKGLYERKARITTKPNGDYQLSFKRTRCTVLFGPDGNPERLKGCKNARDEDWWYLSKSIRLKCKDDRCSGRYEWFDDNDGGADSIWMKIKEPDEPGE